jgi:hypothetical protein
MRRVDPGEVDVPALARPGLTGMTAQAPEESAAPRRFGCLAAPLIGAATAATVALSFSLLTGRPLDLDQEWAVFLFQALIVAAPFALLALAGIRRRAPWLVAGALTLTLWGYYLFEGVSYQWHPDGSGANIGLGLLLLVSPLFIAGAAFGTAAWGARGCAAPRLE